jgi:hypothetical protein
VGAFFIMSAKDNDNREVSLGGNARHGDTQRFSDTSYTSVRTSTGFSGMNFIKNP